jgi:1,4-alpha-glucan branching enzyme
MTSLSLLTNVSLYPNNFIQFQSQHKQQMLTFPRKIKIICSATEQPSQQQPQKKKKNVADSKKGVDPVGFLTKLGISHKAFAHFLRERYVCINKISEKKRKKKKRRLKIRRKCMVCLVDKRKC